MGITSVRLYWYHLVMDARSYKQFPRGCVSVRHLGEISLGVRTFEGCCGSGNAGFPAGFSAAPRPNVCIIATAVNYAKKRQASIALPLVAQWIVCQDDASLDFETRKSRLTWIYDGLSNAATLGDIFSLELPHAEQVNRWAQWTPQEQTEVLEVLRTGEKRPIVDRSENRYGKSYSATIAAGRTMYRTLVKIGEQYGLAKEEFDALLTIPCPRFGEKVFYPFHVLSRSQAQTNGWDWNTVKSLSLFLARTMAKYCNKWATAALHEDHATEAMTYFLAAYYCDRFARIKRDRPTASREEVLWYNLDRWGLPKGLWARHPFKLSLAKDQTMALQ
ncbi:hypothetical protein J3F83DRAFT_228405 [Trichoderma novae-zelandiae]